MKLLIATPAYSGKVHVPYATSLAETTLALMTNGVRVNYNINASGSLLIAERNRILRQFWESDCTHCLLVDGDLGWPSQAVLAMLHKDVEMVCGVYPARGENVFNFWPCLNENKSIVSDDKKGLIKMEYIPAGFMLITRSVMEKLIAKFSDQYYEPKAAELKFANGWMLFNCEVMDGEFWGEDYVFCRKCREAGVDIWVDPLIQFNHAGQIGTLMSVLSNKPNEGETQTAEAPATA